MGYRLLAAGSNSGGQLGSGNLEDSHRLRSCMTSNDSTFPPRSSKILQLSSGANHTLALLEVEAPHGSHPQKEVWVTGSGSQGQIGISNISGTEDEQTCTSYKRLDLEQDLRLAAVIASNFDSKGIEDYNMMEVEPTHVACGWDTSYISFRIKQSREDGKRDATWDVTEARVDSSNTSSYSERKDRVRTIIISLGTANDFGELGIGQSNSSTSSDPPSTVHLIPLPQVIGPSGPHNQSPEFCFYYPWEQARVDSLQAGPRHVLCLLSSGSFPTSKGDLSSRDLANASSSEHNYVPHEKILIGWGAARHGQVGDPPSSPPPSELTANAPGSRTRPGRSGPSSIAWKPRIIRRWMESFALSLEQTQSRVAVGRDHSAFLFISQEPSTSSASLSLSSIGSNRLSQCETFPSNISPPQETSSSSQEEWIPTQVSCCWNTTSVLLQQNSSTPASASDGSLRRRYFPHQAIWSCGARAKGQWGSGESGASESHFANLSSAIPPESSKRIVSLVSGSEHSLILARNFQSMETEVWGWGWSEHGNLAQGDEVDRFSPVLIWPPNRDLAAHPGQSVVNVWAGCGTSFIQVKEDKEDTRS